MMKPLVRWTIGPVRPDGFDCLRRSIDSLLNLYDIEPAVCFNCEPDLLPPKVTKIDQRAYLDNDVPPIGVAWKLYPPRLDITRHEICLDNDVVLEDRIPEIDAFLESDSTLLLEDTCRAYGRFDRLVPADRMINSGIYGMPPGFDMAAAVSSFMGQGRTMGASWQENAIGENASSKTFDEQGLVATVLLRYKKVHVIPNTTVTNCFHTWKKASGYHFIGLNRREQHEAYSQYVASRLL